MRIFHSPTERARASPLCPATFFTLHHHPLSFQAAATVASSSKYDAARLSGSDRATVNAYSLPRSSTPPTDFVRPCGTAFCTGPASNPTQMTFAGTNAFYLMLDHVSDADVGTVMRASAARGANLMRFFAFTNGAGAGNIAMPNPVQPTLGQFNEDALRRMDLILLEARAAGLRLIMPLTNFEDEMGGMQWYVDAGLGLNADGSRKPKELFYTDATVRRAYWRYASLILSRTNTLTGVRYLDDPTIFGKPPKEIGGKLSAGDFC